MIQFMIKEQFPCSKQEVLEEETSRIESLAAGNLGKEKAQDLEHLAAALKTLTL